MKRKLTATTPLGTFTRTTARDYSYVVASRGRTADYYREQNARDLADFTKWLASAEARGNERDAQIERDRIARVEAAVPEEQAQAVTVWGWASRIDLAQKVAAQATGLGYQSVAIYPVDGAA